jgi:hypothetical protein
MGRCRRRRRSARGQRADFGELGRGGIPRGTYSFKATPDIDGITATVDPESGEVLEGEPFEVTVTIEVADTVTDDSAGVHVEAVDDGGDASAGVRIFVDIEQPAP